MTVEIASKNILTDPLGGRYIPSYRWITSVPPYFLEAMRKAVGKDNH